MATWIDDRVEITVEIAFGEDPKATSPTWTDVTEYLGEFVEINRGTSSELTGFSPGTARFTLDNSDRTFDPDYAFGPFYGQLVPMVKVRIVAAVSVTTVTLFTGHILGWSQFWRGAHYGEVEVSAVDGSRFVQNAELAASAYESAVLADEPMAFYPIPSDSNVNKLDDIVGNRDMPSGGLTNVDPTIIDYSFPLGSGTLLSMTEDPDITGTDDFTNYRHAGPIDPPAAIEFVTTNLNDVYTILAVSSTFEYLYATGDFAGGLTFRFGDGTVNTQWVLSVPALIRNGQLNHIVATFESGALKVYRNGALVASTSSSTTGGVAFPAGIGFTVGNDVSASTATIGSIAVYSSALSAARVHEHFLAGLHAYGHPYGERSGERIDRALDEIGWPAGQRSIDTGDTVQGPYVPAGQTLLEYARQVADSEQGLLFFDADGNIRFKSRNSLWTAGQNAPLFSDDSSFPSVIYTTIQPAPNHVDNIRNIATTSYSTVGAITRRDQASIDAYGEGREFTDCPTIDDANTASQLSAYVIRERKDPKVFIERLECDMREASTVDGLNDFETLAAVELGDIIRVRHTPASVTPDVERTVMVSGITHTISAAQWSVSLFCSAAPSQFDAVPYLTVGDADYGKIGTTAGNLIPF